MQFTQIAKKYLLLAVLPGVKQTMFKVSTATSASLPDIGPKLDPISRTFQEFALNAGRSHAVPSCSVWGKKA